MSTKPTTSKPMIVRVTRRFEASAERVFDAWLDPKRASRFLFTAPGGELVRVEIDARVGGKFCFVDRRDGEDIEHLGEYLEIDRPRRLVFSFSVNLKALEGVDTTTRVAIDIVPSGRGCELTLIHEGVFPDYVGQTESGWNMILDGLGASLSRKQAAISFLQLAATGKVRQAYEAYIAPNLRHHNAYFRGDRESLMVAMEEAAAQSPETSLEVQRALEDGDLVAVHSHVRHKPGDLGVAVVHIFRFEGDRVVELWDVGMAVPEDSPNESGLF